MDDTAERINARVCKTAGEFAAAVDVFARDLVPRQVATLQRKIALQALRSVVLKTPVDTGRARGNWQTAIGQTTEDEKLMADPVGEGESVLRHVGFYQIVFLFNNVNYIIYLEDGTSEQAPNGMVQLTLEELKVQFQ